MSNSHHKYHNPPSPATSNYSILNSAVLNDEERDKLRKKQSLKDILKNKRERSSLKNERSQPQMDAYSKYETHNLHREYNKSSTTSPLMKYYKNGTPVFKENRPHRY